MTGTQVPNVQLFMPVGAQLLSILDPDALNTNFSAIASAFSRESAFPAVTGTTQLTSASRNALVDVTGKSANTTIIVTLPTNPAVGDPPCAVVMKVFGNTIPANCIITTSDGNVINGITPDNVNHTNQPSLYSGGDIARFVFVGGNIGWLCNFIGTAISGGAWSGCGALPWQSQTVIATASGMALAVGALQFLGASATVINHSSGAITIGDSGSTFNGVAGPYSLSAGLIATVTCIGNSAFEVTP